MTTSSPAAPCPVCGHRGWRHILCSRDMHGNEWFSIAACTRCGLGRTSDDLSASELARYYNYPGGKDAGRRFVGIVEKLERALRRRRSRYVQRLLPSPGRILDVGCGRGIMLAALARRGWDVWGTELDPEVATTARQTLGERVLIGDVAAASKVGQPFDIITFFHVLEHLPAPQEALRCAVNFLRTGGFLVVELPNWESWQARWFGRHWLHLDVPRHRFHFTPRLLTRLARQFGLELLAVHHFSLEYGPYPLLQSALAAAGFEHVLFTHLLRPGGSRSQLRPALLRHLAISPLLAVGLLLATGLELLAAAAKRGGVVRMVFQRPSR